MNQTNEVTPQSSFAEERAKVEQALRLAKEYWLRTVRPHIAGRILRGVEFFAAQHARWLLQEVIKQAGDWNHLCNLKKDEAHLPVTVAVDLSADDFRAPEVPEMLFADNVKSEILAAIAAPLVKEAAKLTPADAIRNAHELLMVAERYIGTLPEKKSGTESFIADFEQAFSTVTFAEIEASNREGSGQLPLLPPVGQKKKGRDRQEVAERPLNERTPRMSQEQYEREQEQTARLAKAGMLVMMGSGKPRTYQEWQSDNQKAIDDCLNNNRISLQDLCTMRWERFKKSRQLQQLRAVSRETNKEASKEAKLGLPKSAASSPTTVGKRKQ